MDKNVEQECSRLNINIKNVNTRMFYHLILFNET